MGILFNTISMCQFRVMGDLPKGDLFDWASKRLSKFSFQSIDNTSEEVSTGWVQVDDHDQSSFDTPRAFWRDHYLVFALRKDQRRLPSALFRAHLKNAEQEFLAAYPGLRRVPRQKREELSEAVRGALLAKTLPTPSAYDAVWDTEKGTLTLTTLSPKVVELFEEYFKNTFDGVRLLLIHPYARAEKVVHGDLKPALLKANQAPTGDVLDLIEDNQWLGRDFLLWLTYRTMTQSSKCTVNQQGPAQEGESFVAYVNDRLVLLGGEEGAVQKISVVGSQDEFREVRTALKNGKQIVEATLYLEKEEYTWKMTLKGLMFHFASFKSPSVKVEKDNITNPEDEREAAFYERMHVLEEGLQLFDSLFALFLETRLGKAWGKEEKEIKTWMTSGESSP